MVLMANLASTLSDGWGQSVSIPDELIYLRDVDRIIQDIRYASQNNFIGAAVPGYGAAECMLLVSVGDALKRAQVDLAAKNLSLKVYDCYRPRGAVRAFVQWAPSAIKRLIFSNVRQS
jgi:D-alanyl-D-alanine dipeptidase